MLLFVLKLPKEDCQVKLGNLLVDLEHFDPTNTDLSAVHRLYDDDVGFTVAR
jgi:hypothetical protein